MTARAPRKSAGKPAGKSAARTAAQRQAEMFMAAQVRLSCGVDEAGRGPLAGPVYAAAVILNPRDLIIGLADSKVLSAETREALAVQIKARSLAWAIAHATVEEIDRLNILQASLLAMCRAVEALHTLPEEVLVDGNQCPKVRMSVRAIIGGDATVPQISAASILAKTARDAVMCELHLQYPQYGLDRHKGYATREHLEALQRHGAAPIHRRSYAPVRAVMAGAGGFEDDGWDQVELT